jgi:histidyl-tRNA synthetase
MTDKEFIMWLKDFLSSTNIKNISLKRDYKIDYNHTTILKTIYNKLKTVCEKE